MMCGETGIGLLKSLLDIYHTKIITNYHPHWEHLFGLANQGSEGKKILEKFLAQYAKDLIKDSDMTLALFAGLLGQGPKGLEILKVNWIKFRTLKMILFLQRIIFFTHINYTVVEYLHLYRILLLLHYNSQIMHS